MRPKTPKLLEGAIVVDDPDLPDETDVLILPREREDEVQLSAEELADLEARIAEAERGDMIPGDEFFARLRRHT